MKEILESFPQVVEATASHVEERAVVLVNGELDEEAIRKAIEEEEYELISFE